MIPAFKLKPVAIHDTTWQPSDAKVALNVSLDLSEVPCYACDREAEQRTAHLVVLDGLCGEAERKELLEFLTHPGWDHTKGPPLDKWNRTATSDGPNLPKSFGLNVDVLADLETCRLRALREIASRLFKIYGSDYAIAHQPPNEVFLPGQSEQSTTSAAAAAQASDPSSSSSPSSTRPEEAKPQSPEAFRFSDYQTTQFIANAPLATDAGSFHWHVDADPAGIPDDSLFVQRFGSYVNHEPGKPLFVSVLIYLDAVWPLKYDAETLFLDPDTSAGVFVRPRPGRVVIMEQDVQHRISAPSLLAGGRPRYSMVWKLLLLPRRGRTQVCCISRPEWGTPMAFGSAAGVTSPCRLALEQHPHLHPNINPKDLPEGPGSSSAFPSSSSSSASGSTGSGNSNSVADSAPGQKRKRSPDGEGDDPGTGSSEGAAVTDSEGSAALEPGSAGQSKRARKM